MDSEIAEVTLTPKGERWRRRGHPWVFQGDLQPATSSLSGQAVRVKAPNGQPVGQAFFHAQSKIALRWLTPDPSETIDLAFWAKRLKSALEYRDRIVQDTTAYRLIFSESDGFPGLIVDRYGQVLVLQSLSLGIDRIRPILVGLLRDLLNPEAIVIRNDSPIRTLEGLALEKTVAHGSLPTRLEMREGAARYLVDVWEGQKTGAYLDQRENRIWISRYAKGRVLDAFSYQGGFALHLASQAEEVLAIEDSEWAVRVLKENLALNRLTNVQVERDNAFDRLRTLEKSGQRFDLVILDPPAFARSRQELSGALRGYREINLRAMKILQPEGKLITCSCSYHVTDDIFLGILRDAAQDAKRSVRLLEIRTQSKDHPILLTHPESKYLKCVVCEVA